MQIAGNDCDLIELKSTPARLDKHSIFQHLVIYANVNGRQMNTEIYIHLTELKLLKKYKCFEATPVILLNEPMNFFEEHGFLTVQKLTAIWEINEIKMEQKK